MRYLLILFRINSVPMLQARCMLVYLDKQYFIPCLLKSFFIFG